MAIPGNSSALEAFQESRLQVLAQPWAAGLEKADVAEYLRSIPASRVASVTYRQPHDRPLLQPRGGYPTFTKQKALSEALAEAGADFVPLTIDSHTRHNEHDRAGAGLAESEETGKDALNGFPLVNHGYQRARDLYKNVDRPVCLRHGTPDARLLVETALAAGLTEIEGGALCYSLPYSADFPVDRAILYWQYVDRLCAEFSTPERPIHRESFGPLTATMVPPFMVAVVELCELLLALEQGVTSFSVSFGQTGSFTQDIALGSTLMRLARKYADRFGFPEADIYLVYHQWMGAFPQDRTLAGDLISLSAVIARLVKADKIIVKTREEAFGIPTIEANCDALREVRYIFDKLPLADMVSSPAIDEEAVLISSEVESVMERIFELPGDVFWESVFQAVRLGIIDIPFSPHRANRSSLLTVRDQQQAIRVSDPGMVPLSSKDLESERNQLRNDQGEAGSLVSKLMADIDIMR